MVNNPGASRWKKTSNWVSAHRTGVIAAAFWLLMILAMRQYMQANDLTFADVTDQLSHLLRNAWYGPLLYILVYLLRPLILFPASLLTILGGSVFGLWPGLAYVLFAGTASSAVPYGIGRWFSSGEQPDTAGASLIQRFVRLLRKNPFQAVLMMRLVYLPYDAVSLLAGSLRIPFGVFFLATALGNLAGTLSFVGIGASIQGNPTTGAVSLNPTVLVFSVVVLIGSIVLSRLLSRYQKRLQDIQNEVSE